MERKTHTIIIHCHKLAHSLNSWIGVVKTQFGYHLIKLLDKKDVLPFADVKGQIQQYLTSKKQNEMYSNFTQGLKSKYTVEKA